MAGVEITFWIAAALVLYAYVGYPGLLWLLQPIGRFWRRLQHLPEPTDWPAVTLVIPAYREEHSVAPKMDSLRALDYPKDRLRILWLIATHEGDESLEPTLAALERYPEAEYHLVPHRGKIYSLNYAQKLVDTPLVAITDADILLSPQSLRKAVQLMLVSQRIGVVSGRRKVIQTVANLGPVNASEGFYLRYDQQLATLESTFGHALTVTGALLLLRTELWPQMPDRVVDDLYLHLEAGLRGYYSLFAPEAEVYETPSATPGIEFQRKIRIAYTAFYTLRARLRWKDALRHPLFLFFLLSHKIFRYWVAPIGLIVLLISAAILSITGSIFYGLAFLVQAIAWGQALWLSRSRLGSAKKGLRYLPGYFVLAHLAQLIGFWKFLRNEDPRKVWQRLPRTELPYLSK